MTVLVIQSRLGSTRLSGKALLQLNGKPVLAWVFEAMKKVKADRYFLATDYNSAEKLAPLASQYGFECLAGPEEDVLQRFCMVIEKTDADVIIRATGDNPFLFYEAADESARVFAQKNCDYFTFSGLPHGSGVEVFKGSSLLKAAKQTDLAYDHEHVGPALYNHPENFTAIFEPAPKEWNYPALRTTIDTAADFRRAQFMAQTLHAGASCAQIVEQAKKSQNLVLLVPSVAKGQGTGHLRRCIELQKSLFADLYIPQNAGLENAGEFTAAVPEYALVNSIEENKYSLIVADAFCLDKNMAQKLHNIAPVVALDEGSENTGFCDYLLDIIPNVQLQREPNLQKVEFIPLPQNRRKPAQKIEKVLVAFGGEDPAGLTVPVAKAFARNNYQVSAIIPARMSNNCNELSEFSDITQLAPVPNLKEQLCNYDLVVTHYGFTAFEAVNAGCGVLLLATSELHGKLAKGFGFANLQPEEISAAAIKKIMQNPANLFPKSAVMQGLAKAEKCESLSDFVQNLAQGTRIFCPVCGNHSPNGADADQIVARMPNRTIRRCNKCGMLYLAFSAAAKTEYSQNYFFDEYKNQYGKTYLDDFESIKAQGVRRGENIAQILNKNGKNTKNSPAVLDIGCAYGPFLAAAKDLNFAPFGTDISVDAVEYVKNSLKFNAVQAMFPEFDGNKAFNIEEFDAVTMWYVIEHFADLNAVLTKVSDLVKKGGIFAFSTPSVSGVSGKFNTKSFFAQSPSDHFSLWQPETCAKILKKYGFKVEKIVSTGQHPERFPYCKKHNLSSNSFIYKILAWYSKIAKLGDTFEVYCIKEK